MKTIALAVIVMSLTACGTVYQEDLAALKADPMASATLENAESTRRSEQDAGIGWLMGKPSHAEIQVEYTIEANADPQLVKAQALEQAQAAGWLIDDPNEEIVQGTKQLDSGEAEIGIYFVEVEGEDRLLIRLEHGFDHPG